MKLTLPGVKPQFLVDNNGKKTAILLSIADYKTIRKTLEDWHDI